MTDRPRDNFALGLSIVALVVSILVMLATCSAHAAGHVAGHPHPHYRWVGGEAIVVQPAPAPPQDAGTVAPPWERGCTKFDERGNWKDVC
jgi:hypothetical protein